MVEPVDVLYYTAWLMMHEIKFQKAHAGGVSAFPRGPLSYLVNLAIQTNGLSNPLVVSFTETDSANLKRHGTDAKMVREVYSLLCTAYAIEDTEIPSMYDLCSTWIVRRTLKVGAEQAVSLLNSGDYERARSVLASAEISVEEKENPLGFFSSGEDVIKHKWNKSDACPTGLYELDKAWHGGTRGGELGLVVGPTGTGKSMFLAMLASRAFWANKHSLYYTTELSKDQILKRVITGVMQRGESLISTRVPFLDQLVKSMQEQGEEMGEHSNFEVRDGNIAIAQLPSELEDFKEQHGHYPDILFLDDPADMLAPGKNEKDYEKHRATFAYLRMRIAKEYNIPVWCVGQATRDAVDKAFSSLKFIGDAFAKGQKSHYVLGLSQTDTQKTDADGTNMNLSVLKDSLHGTTGAFLLLAPKWGFGGNGYPDAQVLTTKGLNFTIQEPD